MRFGFKVLHQATTWSALADVWRVGDDLDIFESAWTYDHLVALRPTPGQIELDPSTSMLDGWSLLAALAAQTRRLRIGNLVTCVPLRHPALLTKTAVTIDEISGGRLELGLGAGWMEAEAQMYGIDLGSPRQRLDRLEEALEVILGLLTTDGFDFDGRFYSLRQAQIAPKPRDHRLPIWIGGNGERRTCESWPGTPTPGTTPRRDPAGSSISSPPNATCWRSVVRRSDGTPTTCSSRPNSRSVGTRGPWPSSPRNGPTLVRSTSS